MSPKPFLTAVAAAAVLGVPAAALAAPSAAPGPPTDAGKPAWAGSGSGQAKPATGAPGTTTTQAPASAQSEAGTQDDAGAGYMDPLGPTAPATKAKAYGKYCVKLSRRHVAGQQGTPFSQCVTALAKIAHGTVTNPARACKALSRKHVAGQKGTPFSRCVVAAAKLHGDAQDTAVQRGSTTLTPRA